VSNTTVAKSGKKLTIKHHLLSDEMQTQIARALPEHMRADRMTRIALTAMTRTPKLQDCTPESFFRCLLDLSSWGLEPDGRRAHLIPYGKECTLILDYKGIVELCYRSGTVHNIHADVVREGDAFEVSLGKVTTHTPWAFLPKDERAKDAGDIIAAYCIVEMKDATKFEVMTRDEIDTIKKRSRAGSSGPWVTDFAEMAKKTVFRRASKWLPISSEVVEAFDRDFDGQPAIKAASHKKVRTIGVTTLLEGREDGKLFDEPKVETTSPEDE